MDIQEKFHIYKLVKCKPMLNERYATDPNIQFDLATEKEMQRNSEITGMLVTLTVNVTVLNSLNL
jgi:hypothetical protein